MIFELATEQDARTLVALHDGAARWMARRGISQWKPGERDTEHFTARMREGEVWIARDQRGRALGGYELWWSDEQAWGVQPPVAGYVHRLMTDHAIAPAGAGRGLLAHAERRIRGTGRERTRLDCLSTSPRLLAYYQDAGYRVAGEFPSKVGKDGRVYGVVLLERSLSA
ncbi:GNAT family N-acetyltransferase [Streptomyces sp. NPDC006879]|uniref:GNAT family N-acetyltransferase n=1 Tax=Streptomyces sp. NPDC006879 TaxID=3364767 RepID=UPI00369D861D